jgi:hypothetical protein
MCAFPSIMVEGDMEIYIEQALKEFAAHNLV